jgi:cell division protein ZapA (FtsZ GTPase activity inhibitor)
MEQSQEHTFRVNLKVAEKALSFRVGDVTEESYFRIAGELVNNRLAELNKQYGHRMDLQHRLILVAIEALVDAQKAQNNYEKLQTEVEKQLNELESRIPSLQ